MIFGWTSKDSKDNQNKIRRSKSADQSMFEHLIGLVDEGYVKELCHEVRNMH
jgi:hypothetical protein